MGEGPVRAEGGEARPGQGLHPFFSLVIIGTLRGVGGGEGGRGGGVGGLNARNKDLIGPIRVVKKLWLLFGYPKYLY